MSAGALLITAPGVADPGERNDMRQRNPRPDPIERFWSNIDQSCGPNACWHWKLGVNAHGYAQTRLNGVWAGSHRHAWAIVNGPIPALMQIDHVCHNLALWCPGGPSCPHRACCNPAHLRCVTREENMQGLWEYRSGIEFCRYGHPMWGDNLRITTGGTRECKSCRRERSIRIRSLREDRVPVTITGDQDGREQFYVLREHLTMARNRQTAPLVWGAHDKPPANPPKPRSVSSSAAARAALSTQEESK